MSEEEKKPSTLARVTEVLKNLPGASLLFAIGPLMVLGYLGWYYYGAEHLDRALYSLKQANIQVVSPTPPWIKSDIVDEVFRTAGLERISLLDASAAATVADAFKTNNWVKDVKNVRKGPNGSILVDLIFRRPLVMVFYEGPVQDGDQVIQTKGFYPVDTEGIVLRGDDFFSDNLPVGEIPEYEKYFQVFVKGEPAHPASYVGMDFGDQRISEAVELCSMLESVKDEFQIKELVIERENFTVGPSPYVHSLLTTDSPPRKVIWGHAPEKEISGEPTSEEKKQRMIAWLMSDTPGEQPELDLRSSSSMIPVSNR